MILNFQIPPLSLQSPSRSTLGVPRPLNPRRDPLWACRVPSIPVETHFGLTKPLQSLSRSTLDLSRSSHPLPRPTFGAAKTRFGTAESFQSLPSLTLPQIVPINQRRAVPGVWSGQAPRARRGAPCRVAQFASRSARWRARSPRLSGSVLLVEFQRF